jgi:predicted O-methyltransferase YrrM
MSLRDGSDTLASQGSRCEPQPVMNPGSGTNREATVQRVRRVIDRLASEGSATARSDGSVHSLFPVAITPAEGEALRQWVVKEGATQTIEIGLGYGFSALHICEGLLASNGPGAHHDVIDPHQATRFANCGLQFLDEAGVLGLVSLQSEESLTALPRFVGDGRRFGLAFVDGNHRFDSVFLDLVHLARLVHPTGIVFLDDYQLPAVQKAGSFFLKNLGWTLEEVSPEDARHQWAVLRTSDRQDARPFDYFVDF